MLLHLKNILRDKKITNDIEIHELIELASQGLPILEIDLREYLNQLAASENERLC